MPNVWKWTAVDSAGKPVNSAPGHATFTSRGPTSAEEMRAAAQLLLDNQRRKIVRNGGTDPGYKVHTVEPIRDSNLDSERFGQFVPEGDAQPLVIGQTEPVADDTP
jgi:hypothetical protein